MTNDNAPPPAWMCMDCGYSAGNTSLCRAADGSHTFERLARVYLTKEGDERHRAMDCVTEMVRDAPAAACGFLIVACAQCRTLAELCLIAAGPLEDLLEAHGPTVIAHLEKIAKIDPRFRLMLSGTWGQQRIDTAVWTRLVAAVSPGPVIDADGRTPAAGLTTKIAKPHELAKIFAPVPPPAQQH